MKLNLLIFFLLGVSVSASGIRGFTKIKGSERGKRDTRIELTSSGNFVKCTGDKKICRNFQNYCTKDDLKFFRDFGGSTSAKSTSSSKKRRLDKSPNKSSRDTVSIRYINVSEDDLEDCVLWVERSGPGGGSSSSKSRSDKADRKHTTTGTTKAPKTNTGDDRRLASKSKADTKVILSSSKRVSKCSGEKCEEFIRACTDNNMKLIDFRDKSSSSKKGHGRRLKTSTDRSRSRSRSSSRSRSRSRSRSPSSKKGRGRRLKNSGGNIKFYYYTVENAGDCTLVRTVDSSSKGESTKKSEKF